MAINEPTKIEVKQLYVTPSAVQTIQNLLEQRQLPDYYLRVFVAGGGCSGLQYGMSIEAQPDENDTVVQAESVRLVLDPTSLDYLYGSTIDYVDDIMNPGFRIDNPNSAGGCGCGKSFKSKEEEENGTLNSSGGCGTCASY